MTTATPVKTSTALAIGERFGKLVALGMTERRSKNGNIIWECLCDCGNECFIDSGSLRWGNTQSCGCLQKQRVSECNTKHGMSTTVEYKIWGNMIDRCENPNHRSYKDYGGRGIKVCPEWHDVCKFCIDMGKRPVGLTLDRIDNDGDYTPKNCRWATSEEQRINSRPISCGPHKQRWFRAWCMNSMAQWMANNQSEFARKWNLNPSTISACLFGKHRQHKGWIFIRSENCN